MSVTTNIVAKFKQLFHSAGTTSNAVSDAVDALNDIYIAVKVPDASKCPGGNAANATNSSITLTLPIDTKLVSAYMTSTNAIDNDAADTIFVNVSVNGVAAIAFDSDATAGIAANAAAALTVNTVNSYLDAGEPCIISYAQQTAAKNFIDGVVTLAFRRQ